MHNLQFALLYRVTWLAIEGSSLLYSTLKLKIALEMKVEHFTLFLYCLQLWFGLQQLDQPVL